MESLSIESFVRMTWQSTQRGPFNEGNAATALGFSGYAENGGRTLIGVAGSSLKTDPLASANTYRFSRGISYCAGGVARVDQRAYGYLSLDSEVRKGLSVVGINIGAVLVF